MISDLGPLISPRSMERRSKAHQAGYPVLRFMELPFLPSAKTQHLHDIGFLGRDLTGNVKESQH